MENVKQIASKFILTMYVKGKTGVTWSNASLFSIR